MQTRTVQTDGRPQAVLEAGDGPLVLLIHGFPDLALSWHAQIKALSSAGYHAVAPDMRGYGGSAGPDERDCFSILHLVGDMVDLVRAFGQKQCLVVGHDWGAAVAWHCALMRPDMFHAVAGLSVPFQPRRANGPPTPAMAAISKRAGLGDLYISRFQAVDAHALFDADVSTALRKCFYGYDGATPTERQSTGFIPPGQDMLSVVPDDATLPPWMSETHFQEYVAAFSVSGFRAPIDWYRCLDLNWSLTAFLQDRRIEQPSLFIVGERDPVRNYAARHEADLPLWLTDLRGQIVLPGAGHWIQQERADVVSEALLKFIEDSAVL